MQNLLMNTKNCMFWYIDLHLHSYTINCWMMTTHFILLWIWLLPIDITMVHWYVRISVTVALILYYLSAVVVSILVSIVVNFAVVIVVGIVILSVIDVIFVLLLLSIIICLFILTCLGLLFIKVKIGQCSIWFTLSNYTVCKRIWFELWENHVCWTTVAERWCRLQVMLLIIMYSKWIRQLPQTALLTAVKYHQHLLFSVVDWQKNIVEHIFLWIEMRLNSQSPPQWVIILTTINTILSNFPSFPHNNFVQDRLNVAWGQCPKYSWSNVEFLE